MRESHTPYRLRVHDMTHHDASLGLGDASVLAYFADDETRAYQLLQWLPVLETLDATHRVGIVTRDAASAAVIGERTRLPVALAPSFPELTELYARVDADVVLYCNNSMLNFQSLIDAGKLHVHVNHGESDKQSMASNNAKAYDRVFVAGEAAVQRYLAELMEFDESRLVRVGRPQLDLQPAPALPPTSRTTVLYAPTWEGDADYNNFSSLDTLGEAITRQVLGLADVRMVYKPHPKIVTSADPAVRAAHRQVVALISEGGVRDPAAGHEVVEQGDILAVIPGCDAMVTDVSSVGLDWLYLRTEKPILITDRHGDAERLRRDVPVSRCADVVVEANVEALGALLHRRLREPGGDDLRLPRTAMRQHYFGELQVGESTARFDAALDELIERRRRLRGEPLPQDGDGSAATA